MKAMTKNNNINISTAIFIDGSWLYAATRRLNKSINYAEFFDTLIKKFGAESKVYYYDIIDPTNKQQEKFYILLKKIGYIIYYIKVKKIGDKIISSGLDISLAVDAMRILPSLKNIVLVSGDSDFAALLCQARRIGVNTHVIAFPSSMGYLLRQAADAFLNLETLTIRHKQKTLKKETEVQKFISQDYIKKGDSFKSYIKLRNLMKSAKNSIVVIDQYIDDQILLMVRLLKTGIKVIIITNTKKVAPVDFFLQVQKLKKDGHLIDIYNSKKFHDRFICIDNNWWHSGYSFKNLGEKDSMLSKVIEKVAKKINNKVAEVINNSKVCHKNLTKTH